MLITLVERVCVRGGGECSNSSDLQDPGYLRRCQAASLETFFYCYVIVSQALAYSLFFSVNFTFCLFKSIYFLAGLQAQTSLAVLSRILGVKGLVLL